MSFLEDKKAFDAWAKKHLKFLKDIESKNTWVELPIEGRRRGPRQHEDEEDDEESSSCSSAVFVYKMVMKEEDDDENLGKGSEEEAEDVEKTRKFYGTLRWNDDFVLAHWPKLEVLKEMKWCLSGKVMEEARKFHVAHRTKNCSFDIWLNKMAKVLEGTMRCITKKKVEIVLDGKISMDATDLYEEYVEARNEHNKHSKESYNTSEHWKYERARRNLDVCKRDLETFLCKCNKKEWDELNKNGDEDYAKWRSLEKEASKAHHKWLDSSRALSEWKNGTLINFLKRMNDSDDQKIHVVEHRVERIIPVAYPRGYGGIV